ncbi:hypothetical protein [Amycolatopsis vastitatis]|uniref:Lipoprotein n=1 Tax=Amycolatopsis vastitatis TaxID=1905142 RepID=A0A229SK31_9PSEU|nr:hypothetical protein [Amycolatopsis vastitatis]OXM59119.1 hypothetical protein CF165_49325 [Amycolatopsis vastitatis]
MNRTSTTTLLVTLAALAAGCAAQPTAPAPDAQLLHDAEQLVLRDCMAKAGFEYRITPPPSVPDQREFLYVVDDVEWARKHGYGSDIQRRLDAFRADDPNQRYLRSLPADRRTAAVAAANGTKPVGLTAKAPDGLTVSRSDQGCRTEVFRELYGDPQTWFQTSTTVNALKAMRVERVNADPAYVAALVPWSSCVHSAGYDAKNPTELRAGQPGQLAFADEQRMAVAEADCAVHTGLAATAKALDARYETELSHDYQAALDTQHRLQQAALPHARDLLRQDNPDS